MTASTIDVIRCSRGTPMRRIFGTGPNFDIWVCETCRQVKMSSAR